MRKALAMTQMVQAGEKVANYMVERLIEGGGLGEIYLVRQVVCSINQPCIKNPNNTDAWGGEMIEWQGVF